VLRALDADARKLAASSLQIDVARVFVNDAAGRIEIAARDALAAMTAGDMLRTTLAALRRLLKVTPINTVVLRRTIAEETTAKGRYPFSA